ncbi:hypothetical protein PC115_g20948 [Phytophthora cactorum]|uniref:Uncharacterized protein n=1 Tax=Phytophthora cactorum TaxID=29920 RepID=A0A8T1ARG8_9STRA|nr:hypothetical protein PC115_g20948 [Phytophthora cactorum]
MLNRSRQPKTTDVLSTSTFLMLSLTLFVANGRRLVYEWKRGRHQHLQAVGGVLLGLRILEGVVPRRILLPNFTVWVILPKRLHEVKQAARAHSVVL